MNGQLTSIILLKIVDAKDILRKVRMRLPYLLSYTTTLLLSVADDEDSAREAVWLLSLRLFFAVTERREKERTSIAKG
jgi:hypothetical protein